MNFNEIPALSSGKRCGVQWTPWMDDWFTSWSPRNGNNHAEGPWDHWVDLALRILADPMTKLVRPEVFDEEYRGLDHYSSRPGS
ncbi:hypothetical protein GS872_02025 [Rhodococcus hoagii]|nr:hypothetical protein [Prescottella equi]